MNTPQNVFEKFSRHLRRAIAYAGELAVRSNGVIEPIHLLGGLARTEGALSAELLTHAKFDVSALETFLQEAAGTSTTEKEPATPQLSPRSQERILSAATAAYREHHPYIGTEHLLRAILDDPGPEMLSFTRAHQWSTDGLKEQLELIFKSGARLPELTETFSEEAEEPDDMADDLPASTRGFGTHLTDTEHAKRLDPVIGRDSDIERLMQILARRTKNNPVLLGDPGVGKTAIVEGLAKRLASGDVPIALKGKKILSLDVGGLIAGTMFRGEFENRIKQLVDELKRRPDIIIFIDELHTIVGAGAASGSVDAANLLKPALARGELRCIGATTVEEYRQHIESDGALERRFQPIHVNEPTPAETRHILEGIRQRYETYHGLSIDDTALDAAVHLSERYLPDRFLPDKAIDLIDEAAARVKIQHEPPALIRRAQELEEAERLALRRKETAVSREQFTDAHHWQQEAERLHRERHAVADELEKHPPTSLKVTRDEVAAVLTNWTKVPVADLLEEERDQLRTLEERLAETFFGHDHIRTTVANTVRRARLGLSDRHRPLASFLVVGESGVGKTTLAKAIARTLFGDPQAMLAIDMSEFSEGFTVSKLIGAPAGYVGYKESGLLTERVRRKPYQVILFDELDRAHRDVYQLLLQILGEGSLRDATGKLINFKQTIVVATANPMRHGSNAGLGFGSTTGSGNAGISDAVRDILPVELVQRFDAVLSLGSLQRDDLARIVQHEVERMNERIRDRRLHITVSKEALAALVAEASNEPGQARAVERRIRQLLESELASKLLTTATSRRAKSLTLHRSKAKWVLK